MRAWSGSTCPIKVQFFDILNVVQASRRSAFPEPLCRMSGVNTQRTFQNVCSYYDVRIVVRFKW